jgi:hypothetical protein
LLESISFDGIENKKSILKIAEAIFKIKEQLTRKEKSG